MVNSEMVEASYRGSMLKFHTTICAAALCNRL